MSSFLLKNIPKGLHKRLQEDAEKHHRSMNKHVIALLEESLGETTTRREFSAPVKVAIPMTDDFLDKAKRWGRA